MRVTSHRKLGKTPKKREIQICFIKKYSRIWGKPQNLSERTLDIEPEVTGM